MKGPLLTRKRSFVVLAVGFLLLVICLILMLIFPTLYTSLLHKQIVLLNGTTTFDDWKDIPLPIYERVYFFNITNPREFYNGAKLNVSEVGPYTFRSKWVKYDIGWFSNHTVSYREVRTYQFVPEMSNGFENDTIITLNGPLLTAANILKDYSMPIKLLATIFLGLENEQIIIRKSVRELTYDGYEDPIIKYGIYVIPDLPYKDGIFGWLTGKNATDDGLITVFTGEDDIYKLGLLDNWNGANKMGFWKGDTCNMVNGTNIEMGPPLKDNQQTYTFFQSIFCRSWTLQYSNDDSILGIPCKNFIATSSILANESKNPDNYCFQTEKNIPSGVQDVSRCQFGAPVFFSYPHFYLGDPSFLEGVNGLEPKEENHSTYIKVHPVTGVSLDGKARFQINLKIEKVHGILQVSTVQEGIFPVLWVELDFAVDEKTANMLKSRLSNPKIIFYAVVGLFMAISIVLIIGALISLIVLYISDKKDGDDEPLIDPDKGDTKNPNSKKPEVRKPNGSAKQVGSSGDNTWTNPGYDDDAALIDAGVVPNQMSGNGFNVKI